MKRNYIAIITITILVSSMVFAQEKAIKYINEDFIEISKIEYERKNNSPVYLNKAYDLDAVVYKSVFLKYLIGKIQKTTKKQLFSILAQRNNIDTTKSILIHYKDTLKSIAAFPSKDSMVYYKNGVHKHIISHKTFVTQHKSCEKKNSDKHIAVYHFYNHNEGHPTNIKKVAWQKDNLSLLRRLFYNSSLENNYWYILIHPNGDYAINYFGINPSKKWKELKKHKNWDTYFSEFKKNMSLINE